MPKLKRTNLSNDAYDFVKNLLINGKRFTPGDKISVEELSRELGVSRTPIWGAINRLEAEGVVEIVPRQGVFLIKFDPVKAFEVYVAREALEGMAARLAAVNITDSEIRKLEKSIERQRELLQKSDVDGYLNETMIFHQLLVKYARNSVLERLLGSIFVQMQAMRARVLVPTKLPDTCQDHDTLVNALKRRDPEDAERLARMHIQTLATEVQQSAEEREVLHASGSV